MKSVKSLKDLCPGELLELVISGRDAPESLLLSQLRAAAARQLSLFHSTADNYEWQASNQPPLRLVHFLNPDDKPPAGARSGARPDALFSGSSIADVVGVAELIERTVREEARPICPCCGIKAENLEIESMLEGFVEGRGQGVLAVGAVLPKEEKIPLADYLEMFAAEYAVVQGRLISALDAAAIAVDDYIEPPMAAVLASAALPLSLESKQRLKEKIAAAIECKTSLTLFHIQDRRVAGGEMVLPATSLFCPSCRRSFQGSVQEMLCNGSRCQECGGVGRDHPESICSVCGGSGVNLPYALEVLGVKLHELLSLPFAALFSQLNDESAKDSAPALLKVVTVIRHLMRVGLGELSFLRAAADLSPGERLRLQLAFLFIAEMSDIILVAEGTDRFFTPEEDGEFKDLLSELAAQGNVCILATFHAGVAESQRQSRMLSVASSGIVPEQISVLVKHWLWRSETLEFLTPSLICIQGASGVGKTRLLTEVLKPLFVASPGLDKRCRVTKGDLPRMRTAAFIEGGKRAVGVSIPAAAGLVDEIANCFAVTREARQQGVRAEDLVYPGRFICRVCKGSGIILPPYPLQELDMELFERCDKCTGLGVLRPAADLVVNGRTFAEAMALPVSAAEEYFFHQKSVAEGLELLSTLGFSRVQLRYPVELVSAAGVRRLAFAARKRSVGAKPANRAGRNVFMLDRPFGGLLFQEREQFAVVMRRLVEQGHTVFLIDNSALAIEAADCIIRCEMKGCGGGCRAVLSCTTC